MTWYGVECAETVMPHAPAQLEAPAWLVVREVPVAVVSVVPMGTAAEIPAREMPRVSEVFGGAAYFAIAADAIVVSVVAVG